MPPLDFLRRRLKIKIKIKDLSERLFWRTLRPFCSVMFIKPYVQTYHPLGTNSAGSLFFGVGGAGVDCRISPARRIRMAGSGVDGGDYDFDGGL